ncbi:MAG: molecular chaperone [Candidatus Hydrothermarchaeales archaeon]
MAVKQEEMTMKDFKELSGSRAQTYLFLASLFYYDSLPVIKKSIRNKSILSGLTPSGKGFKMLKKFVEQDAPKIKNLLEELQIEHTALFVMGKLTKGRPYESFYLDRDRKIGARVTINVGKFYKSAGVKFTDAQDEISDYIAIELEFMYHMCKREEEAWKDRDKEHAVGYLKFQKDFITEHLGKWVDPFVEDTLEETKLDFFKAACHLLTEFMEIEKAEILDLVEHAEKIQI